MAEVWQVFLARPMLFGGFALRNSSAPEGATDHSPRREPWVSVCRKTRSPVRGGRAGWPVIATFLPPLTGLSTNAYHPFPTAKRVKSRGSRVESQKFRIAAFIFFFIFLALDSRPSTLDPSSTAPSGAFPKTKASCQKLLPDPRNDRLTACLVVPAGTRLQSE